MFLCFLIQPCKLLMLIETDLVQLLVEQPVAYFSKATTKEEQTKICIRVSLKAVPLAALKYFLFLVIILMIYSIDLQLSVSTYHADLLTYHFGFYHTRNNEIIFHLNNKLSC